MAVAAVLITAPVAAADPAETTSPSAPPSSESSTETTTETTTGTTTETTTETTTSAPGTTAPGTESPATEPEAPREDVATVSVDEFTVSATFDKPSYVTGENMRVTVTVKNNGAAADTVGASVWTLDDPDLVRPRDIGDLIRDIPIAAGATVTMKFVGTMANPDITTARLRLAVWDDSGATKFFEFTVPVTPRFAHANGTAFDDRDGDNRFDTSEALAGVTLTWQNDQHQESRFTVTTGADGTFSIPRMPTGIYAMDGTAPNGLDIGYRTVVVGESGVDGMLVRAVRPVTDLVVDLEFAKETYGKDEAPVVHVTLTNSGDLPLTGIVANCNRVGNSDGLWGRGPGWGALGDGGVDIAPHSTLELDVTEPMPEFSYRYGRVWVGCDFGYEGVTSEHNPNAHDEADVPGMLENLSGFVGHDETGLGDVRVVAVSDDRCPTVVEATTDADGRFTIKQVPVGDYDVYFYPPKGWQVRYDNPQSTRVIGDYPPQLHVEVERGDAPAPKLPRRPADCAPGGGPTATTTPPAPQGSPAPGGLASTGASIGAPVVIGALALLAGVGALLVTRRRRTS